MTPEGVARPRESRSPTALRWAGWMSVGVAVTVMAGWLLGLPALTSIVPGQIAMKFNTALVFLGFGVGAVLVASARPSLHGRGYALLAVGASVSAVIGLQYPLDTDFGIDQLLVREAEGAVGTVHLGRMSPQTSVSFIAIAIAAFFSRVPGVGPFVVALGSAVGLLLGAINLIDFIYAAEAPTFLRQYTQMAIPTATVLTALSLGVLELLPQGGPIGRLRSSAGSAILRPMLVAAVVVPIAVGWLRLEGERLGLYESAYGVGITTLTTIALFVVAVWVVSGRLNRADDRRLAAERQLAAAKTEAEAANRAKSEFLSRMSHELRTPLNSVLGFAQLLEMDGLETEQQENVRYISRAGRHLLELINEVLDISRIETGTMAISLEPVRVSDVTDEVLTLIRPLAAQRGVTLIADALADCTEHVLADRQRMRQVLLNLLSNAVKYNRPGGEIRMDCVSVGKDRVRIDVTDTGLGIPADRLDRLFTPFDRLGAERTDVEGTGMGLALSRALVQAMNGSLDVRSKADVGSTFSVELVRAKAPSLPAADLAALSGRPAADRERTVLYVDDNLAHVRLVERLVERLDGVRLMSTGQGREGVELAVAHRPELILLDMHLPDMTGLEVLREIRSRPEIAASRVVMLTADGSSSRMRQVLKEGAASYLRKPIDVPRFVEILDETLGGVSEATNAT